MSAHLLEGRNSIIEALRSGMPLERILVARGVKPGGAVTEIERLARAGGVRLEPVDRQKLDALSDHGAHQGVVAYAAPFRFTELATMISRAADKDRSLVIALDHVTDPGNLGAIARSAEVAGAEGVLVTKRRSAAITPVAFKASAGALAHVAIAQETNLVRSLETLKEAGYWIAGADGTARDLVWDAPLDGRLVLVMGAEGEGLSRLTRDTCDFLVRLPVAGAVDSLNVAQATTVLAFEWVRRGVSAR